jgi:BCD family chlorophyll transporter-like MFS transporter
MPVSLEVNISKRSLARLGGLSALEAFGGIIISGMILSEALFYSGVVLLGLATGVSTVSNLSLMLDMTIEGRVGMFMGAWGTADAFARLTGSVTSGVVRDVVSQMAANPVSGYLVVFAIEAVMLVISLVLLGRIDVGLFRQEASSLSVVERAAIANEA